MTPAELAAAKAGEMLDQAAEHILDAGYVTNCVTIADAWMRLHTALATSAFMGDGH
ncbi:hypothetical protein AB0392_37820 [Nonomuraea angiospora]|uniref:hypothetical protein n=1 Tax=Nonomuraea angiospora TaxID=46172 RepID=UPI00344D1593